VADAKVSPTGKNVPTTKGRQRMEVPHKLSALAATLGASALIAGLATLTPGAQAAATVHKCGNRSETILIESTGTAPQVFKTMAKDITAQGVTCAAAYKFVALVYKNKTSTVPEGYKCAIGHFKPPAGYVPEVCTHHSAKIQYAGPGG
jgi:hypothetical protein